MNERIYMFEGISYINLFKKEIIDVDSFEMSQYFRTAEIQWVQMALCRK